MRRAFVLLMALMLAACGQSGDLYLPDEPAPAAADAAEQKPDEKKLAPERAP